jgi:hypothetical protein
MLITTLVLWLVFVFVLFNIDPLLTNFLGFFLFYLSLFAALSGTFTILGFLWRFKFRKQEMVYYSAKKAFRQSFLLSFFVVAILFLLAKDLFSWFNLALLVVVVVISEYFLISIKREKI